jgi:3-hydroxyisobutyrate dehydrogenase
MAPHFIKKNFVEKLYVYDINQESVQKLENVGAIKCETIEEISQKSEIIITMLPASKHVKDVYEKLLSVSKPNQFFIDNSTIDPKTAQEVCLSVKKNKSTFVDAPGIKNSKTIVSGGVGGAEAGTLTFMVYQFLKNR